MLKYNASEDHNAKWLRDAQWGVLMRFLTEPETTAEEWNRKVDNFDVDARAAQLAEVGAGYFFIPLGQGSGHYCAPTETYDQITSIHPSKCSRQQFHALVAFNPGATRPSWPTQTTKISPPVRSPGPYRNARVATWKRKPAIRTCITCSLILDRSEDAGNRVFLTQWRRGTPVTSLPEVAC